MHVLAQYGKENAAAIFELFLECMPKYPIDMPDAEGNTRMYISFTLYVLNINLIVVKPRKFVESYHKVDNSYWL